MAIGVQKSRQWTFPWGEEGSRIASANFWHHLSDPVETKIEVDQAFHLSRMSFKFHSRILDSLPRILFDLSIAFLREVMRYSSSNSCILPAALLRSFLRLCFPVRLLLADMDVDRVEPVKKVVAIDEVSDMMSIFSSLSSGTPFLRASNKTVSASCN